MKLLKGNANVNFMGHRKIAAVFSVILLIASVISLLVQGLNLGIDFTGGTLVHVVYPQAADLNQVRTTLSENGLDDVIAKNFGTSMDVEIRVPPQDGLERAELGEKVIASLKQKEAGVELQRVDYVGPQVGKELTEDGITAVIFALIGILVYVALRFQFKFAVGAVLALAHDVIVTLGLFSMFRFDFDLTVVAAILAIIGYSLNDTIVVYDRIREKFRKLRKATPVDVINKSINKTFGRTLMTSITTMLVLLALFFVGGDSVHYFALSLLIGVVVGTYSSIYVASTVLLAMGVSKQDLMLPEKEGEATEEGV